MRPHRIVLGLALVLVAGCSKKEQANTAAAPAAEQAAPATPVAAPVLYPCTLLTADEVKEALGADVTGPMPNTTNPAVCDFKVGTGGVLNITAKATGPQKTIDATMAEMKKRSIPVSEKTGPAQSFYASPGYGMAQLNTFQNGKYVIITMLVPGAADAQQKDMLQKLMARALARL